MRISLIKAVIAGWTIAATAASAGSDYGPMTLFQLLTANDVAVHGVVHNVRDERYELEAAKSYRASDNPQKLVVIRFDSYPPDSRSGGFAEGDSIVLFAISAEEGQFRPLGKAGEGELARDAEYVYVREMSRPPENVVRTAALGETYAAYRIDAEIFDQAVTGFYACYETRTPRDIERMCSDEAQNRYRRSSWLARHLSGIAERLISGGN